MPDMLQTYVDGFPNPSPTNVVPQCRLGYWRFDSPLLYAEQGQMPLSTNDVSLAPSWSGTALVIGSSSNSQVTYPDVGSNGWANINCRQGCLRFWFKPNSSSSAGPFVYMGDSTKNSNVWTLELTSSNTINFYTSAVQFGAESQTTVLTALATCLSTSSWTQIVLNYGTTSCTLYTNGFLAATNAFGNFNWPSLSEPPIGHGDWQ
jgi:hypothetical protein